MAVPFLLPSPIPRQAVMSAITFTTLTRIPSEHARSAILYDIASVQMETERGTADTSCSSDIRESFFKTVAWISTSCL